MKITIDIDPLQLYWLRAIVGVNPEIKSIDDVLRRLISMTAEGARRQQSWEANLIDLAFGGDVECPEDADQLGHAYAFRRPESGLFPTDPMYAPPGWIGRVTRADLSIAFETEPLTTEYEALTAARAWLADSDLRPLEDELAGSIAKEANA